MTVKTLTRALGISMLFVALAAPTASAKQGGPKKGGKNVPACKTGKSKGPSGSIQVTPKSNLPKYGKPAKTHGPPKAKKIAKKSAKAKRALLQAVASQRRAVAKLRATVANKRAQVAFLMKVGAPYWKVARVRAELRSARRALHGAERQLAAYMARLGRPWPGSYASVW